MAASFRQLHDVLEPFEREQFNSLWRRELRGVPDGIAHGGVQFVALDTAPQGLVDPDTRLPVVVGVGINYCQDSVLPIFPRIERWLVDQTGSPTVLDNLRDMRSAANKALDAHHRNTSAWVGPCMRRKSHAANVKIAAGSLYILIATNFCPLITIKPWSEYGRVESNALLRSVNSCHLAPLVALIGGQVDLWIGHGTRHWDRFDRFREAAGITQWMLTYNLSGLGSVNMDKARSGGHPLYM